MKNLTESKAVSILTANGGEVRGKIVTSKNGLKGLSACSALDYLCNHCNYIANL